jgi:hypothetical protein
MRSPFPIASSTARMFPVARYVGNEKLGPWVQNSSWVCARYLLLAPIRYVFTDRWQFLSSRCSLSRLFRKRAMREEQRIPAPGPRLLRAHQPNARSMTRVFWKAQGARLPTHVLSTRYSTLCRGSVRQKGFFQLNRSGTLLDSA